MKPKAIRSLATVRGTDGLLRLEMVDAGRQVVLDPLAELVWDLSDGSRSLEDLAQAAGRAFDRVVEKEEVFSALDFLADAGLLEERVAPPVAEGKVSRRSLLVRMAPVVGVGACMMLGASARAGLFQEGSEKSSKETASKEPGWKESEAKDRGELDRKIDDGNKELSKQARHRAWYESHKGRLDRTGKYAVAPNHPLVGTWKYVAQTGCPPPACAEIAIVLRYYSSGICEDLNVYPGELNNWKYTSTGRDTTGRDTGVLEEFLGERIGKSYISWIAKDEIERNTPGEIFPRKRYVRQFSSNRRESR